MYNLSSFTFQLGRSNHFIDWFTLSTSKLILPISNETSMICCKLDGTIMFSDNMDEWPRESDGDVFECIHFFNIYNATFTSSGIGTFNGQGETWWGLPGIGYLVREENRPRLFNIVNSKSILVENLYFLDSPYWTFYVHDVDGLEVRFCEIRLPLILYRCSVKFQSFQRQENRPGPPWSH